MSYNFTGKTALRTPRPRSRRLRDTGGTGGSVSASSQSSAVTDHNQLFGRESQGAHPIDAVTGLTAELAARPKVEFVSARPAVMEEGKIYIVLRNLS